MSTSTTSILELPSHVLVQIASYLDPSTLKSLAEVHSYLTPAAETYLYRRLVLPVSNPHHSVPHPSPYPSSNPPAGSWCDHDVTTSWEPVKPSLASRLADLGWEEDEHQSNHLDASMRLITKSLTSKSISDRTTYPRELVMDLKKCYHDVDVDLDTISFHPNTTNTIAVGHSTIHPPDRTGSIITPERAALGTSVEENVTSDHKPTLIESEWDVGRSTLLHLSRMRQLESPEHDPHLYSTFSHFPILLGVKRVEVGIYESYLGYLPHLLHFIPNLIELVLRPRSLLVESHLEFPLLNMQWPGSLESLRIDGMIDSLQPLVVDLLTQCDIRDVVLSDVQETRPTWTITRELIHALTCCETLEKIHVGRAVGAVLRKAREWPEGVLVEF